MTKENTLVFGDTIKIKGEVEVRNGDTFIIVKNKFVQTLLQHICNIISLGYIGPGGSVAGIQGPQSIENIYLGTDIGTPTYYNTTALTAPIGTAPGTAPNTIVGNTSNPSNGVFRISITATWNPNTVSGTVGEMGLYLLILGAGNLKAFASGSDLSPGSRILASRISVADGSFTAFAINNTRPLAVTWTITINF